MYKLQEEKMTDIVYLGPNGSYSESAAEEFIKILDIKDVNKLPKASITEVIQSIDCNSDVIGIVPIENSIEGIVRETVDTLVKTTSRVMITREYVLPIANCLISKSKDISSIRKVISYKQALAQCNGYIINNLPKGTEKVYSSSTSEAVQQLTELDETYAAIGNKRAAEIYNLNILAENINDEKDNFTRFVCLSSQVTTPTGRDKSSMAFSTCNAPGALVSVLNTFNENNINLSYIESRPSKKVFGDYTFFIDFDGHIEDEKIQKTIGKIAPFVNFYRFLGSYPKF